MKPENLWAGAAASGKEEGLLRLAYQQAKSAKDEKMLVGLARNPNLPADLQKELDASKSARILVARISREGAGEEVSLAGAKDPRVTVRAEIASVGGLTKEVYAALLEGPVNVKICKNLMDNAEAPLEVRVEALKKMAGMPPEKLEYSVMYWETKKRAKALLGARPEAISEVLKAGVPSSLTAEICTLEGAGEEEVETLILAALEGVVKQGAVRHPWEAGSEFQVSKSFIFLVVRFGGIKNEILDKCRGAFKITGADHLAEFERNVNMKLVKYKLPQTENSRVAALIAGCLGLEEVLDTVAGADLTDEEYKGLMLGTTGVWEHSPGRIRNLEIVKKAARAAVGNPLRVALLAARVPPEMLEGTGVLDERFEEAIAATYENIPESANQYLFKTEWWMPELLRRGLEDEGAKAIPAKVRYKEKMNTWEGEAENRRVLKSWNIEVAEWTWRHFGDDLTAWNTLASTGENLPGSMLDALGLCQEIVERKKK